MTEACIPTSRRKRFDSEALLPVALFASWLCLLVPWWSVYQFGTDEGINLMKGALVAEGHSLYHEIWSDQPPVLTFILAAAQLVFSNNIVAARAIVLAFASLLLWSLYRVVRRSQGPGPAWVAVVALCGSGLFQLLSVSVMIGLPSIALALAAIDHAMAGALDGRRRRFVLAGILFGLSLQTKLFTLLVLPSLIYAISDVPNGSARVFPWPSWARQAGLTIAAAAATFLIIAAATREPIFTQLIMPHLGQRLAAAYSQEQGWGYLAGFLAQEPILLILAALGLGASLARPRRVCVVPILWCALALLAFAHHRPLWDHHVLIILVPLAWLGGSAVRIGSDWFDTIAAKRNRLPYSCMFILVAVLIASAVVATWRFRAVTANGNPNDGAAVAALLSHSQGERWVLTDYPMDAYRAGLLVPPELAVYSRKRLIGGYLPAQLVTSVIRERRPAQVMFRRFPIDPEVENFLAASSYVRISTGLEERYYIRPYSHSSK